MEEKHEKFIPLLNALGASICVYTAMVSTDKKTKAALLAVASFSALTAVTRSSGGAGCNLLIKDGRYV